MSSLFSAGIHPWDVEIVNPELFIKLETMLAHPNCFAVGECGLDKITIPDPEIQQEVFKQQLQLAVKYNKPVIIHCVKAFDELIAITRRFHDKVPLVIHGFNKSAELAKQLIQEGFYLSLNAALLKKEHVDFRSIPLGKLFLETDVNQQISIEEVYSLASLKFGINPEKLKEQIYLNFEGLNTKHK